MNHIGWSHFEHVTGGPIFETLVTHLHAMHFLNK